MWEFVAAKVGWDVLKEPVRKVSPDAELECKFREPEYPLLFDFDAYYYLTENPEFLPHKYWYKNSFKCGGGMLKIKTLQTRNPLIAQIEGWFRYDEEFEFKIFYDDRILRNDQDWSEELIGGFLCLACHYYNYKKAEYLSYVSNEKVEELRIDYEKYRPRQKNRWINEIGDKR
jgi:hypothetical protein